MEQGEKQCQHAAVLPFTRQKHPFPGNKAVVENQVGICGALHEPALEMFSGSEVVNGHYLLQPVPVSGNGEGHGIVLILRA